MTPARARMILALASTVSPDPREQVDGWIMLATERAAARLQPWWSWTAWVAASVMLVWVDQRARSKP